MQSSLQIHADFSDLMNHLNKLDTLPTDFEAKQRVRYWYVLHVCHVCISYALRVYYVRAVRVLHVYVWILTRVRLEVINGMQASDSLSEACPLFSLCVPLFSRYMCRSKCGRPCLTLTRHTRRSDSLLQAEPCDVIDKIINSTASDPRAAPSRVCRPKHDNDILPQTEHVSTRGRRCSLRPRAADRPAPPLRCRLATP